MRKTGRFHFCLELEKFGTGEIRIADCAGILKRARMRVAVPGLGRENIGKLFCKSKKLETFAFFHSLCKQMKTILKVFALLSILAVSGIAAGCTSNGDDDAYVSRQKPGRNAGVSSKTPWARPANWEGGLPGMGTGNMPNQY